RWGYGRVRHLWSRYERQRVCSHHDKRHGGVTCTFRTHVAAFHAVDGLRWDCIVGYDEHGNQSNPMLATGLIPVGGWQVGDSSRGADHPPGRLALGNSWCFRRFEPGPHMPIDPGLL